MDIISLVVSNLVTLFIAGVGGIFFIARIEGKVNLVSARTDKVEAATEQNTQALNTHISKNEIHHNPEHFREFQKRMDDKFDNVTKSVDKLEDTIQDGLDEMNKRLDKFFGNK